jgi:hypothetical protein
MGLTAILVVQVETEQPSATVHLITDTPTLNTPLASTPVPLRFVAPVISYPIVRLPEHFEFAVRVGIL